MLRPIRRPPWVTHLCAFCLLTGLISCGARSDSAQPAQSGLSSLRSEAPTDDALAAQWLLGELLLPGGQATQASRARQSLDHGSQHGLFEDLARALDDDWHGHLADAPDHYLRAAEAARDSNHDAAPLVAWFSAFRAVSLSANTRKLWGRWQPFVEQAIADPKNLGWRARDVLVNWRGRKAWEAGATDVEQTTAEQLGCLRQVRLAGPFGNGGRASALRVYAAETPQPWPVLWPEDPLDVRKPRILETDQKGCEAFVDEPVRGGVFYAEAFFSVDQRVDTIITADHALMLWVDGEEVLNRDFRRFAAGNQIAAGLSLEPGTHRIVAKLLDRRTSLRLLTRDGRPLPFRQISSAAALSLPAPSLPPTASFSPATGFERVEELSRSKASPSEVATLRFLAAFQANVNGEPGYASLLLEPLVKNTAEATGPALNAAATFVAGDPIYGDAQRRDLERELHATALERDPQLWESELEKVSQVAQTKGLADAVSGLRQLTERYPQVPALLGALARVYGELGWKPEHRAVVLQRAERFPEDPDGLYGAAQLLEQAGDSGRAEELLSTIRRLDPDSEVMVGRALERRDYDAALVELERLSQRRPNRKDLKDTLSRVRRLSGKGDDVLALLERAIQRKPTAGLPRLNLADAHFASGQTDAIRTQLVEAIQVGADPKPLKNALDLIEGLTELDPYRLDGSAVIAAYEAAGKHMAGTAARVLDYMAVWVGADGSSRNLDHQVIRLQSEEAIRRFAEQAPRGDLVLKMRVIKKDGRILEPEAVPGKPTFTFPHLEVGDYIETEQLFSSPSTAGSFYEGPHWFFREKDIAYARSELVLISPSQKQLDIATTGSVPEPSFTQTGYFDVRRWRMDQSPAAPNEPLGVPAVEYLPSVKITWGLNLRRHLRSLFEQSVNTLPVDPRVARIARRITTGIPSQQETNRAKALYRWVLNNVQNGDEADGRRVVVGKRGVRWRGFVTLCHALGIETRFAVSRTRLTPPPKGQAELAGQYRTTVLRVGTENPVWLTMDSQYTPFGYLPSEVRGMPAYLLGDQPTLLRLPSAGSDDKVTFEGTVRLAADGSANLSLNQGYHGRLGASLRKGLAELGEQRLNDEVESRILASSLRGARLLDLNVVDLDNHDVPVFLQMQAEMAHFALKAEGQLRLSPPFAPRLSRFASLPSRQTPILLSSEQRWDVHLKIELPPDARVELPVPVTLRFGDHLVEVSDSFQAGRLTLRRKVHLRTGRVAPEDYPDFVRFTREADAALSAEIQIQLP